VSAPNSETESSSKFKLKGAETAGSYDKCNRPCHFEVKGEGYHFSQSLCTKCAIFITMLKVDGNVATQSTMYEGRSINKLQNDIILLIFKI